MGDIMNKFEDWILGGGTMPVVDLPEIPSPDSVLVVDRKTGCMFMGNKLWHTDLCSCGDYDESF